MNFPDINTDISEITIIPEYATIKTEFEGGYQQTRERHSRNRHTITAKYFLSSDNKDLLLEHYNTVKGSQSFAWRHPESGKVYTVRYDKAPSVPSKAKSYGWHEITLNLKEV